MKYVVTIGMCIALLFTGCGKAETGSVDTQTESSAEKETDRSLVEIKEKMFLTQVDEIYLNYGDYLGKTITYEGIYTLVVNEETRDEYPQVIRYAPGCCGDDGISGFEIEYGGEYPQEEEWVRVTGTLETYEEYGEEYLRIVASEVTVLETRGTEFVTQ